ncbi:SDR family oxidoreductase, partial [Calditrichota bacterium]
MPSKLAFITGASKGIGRAVAMEAAASGLDVIITARNETELNSLAKEIESKDKQCYVFKADLNLLSEVENLLTEVKKINQQISLLVHSAGVAKVGLVKDMSIEDWQLNLKSNLTAPFLLTQKLLPAMDKNSQIVFINSVAGRQSFPEWSSYCATKYGLKAFADSLRQEVAADEIRVTTIFPASVDTPMQDSLPYDWDRTKMLQTKDVAKAVMYCYNQSDSVLIKEL